MILRVLEIVVGIIAILVYAFLLLLLFLTSLGSNEKLRRRWFK